MTDPLTSSTSRFLAAITPLTDEQTAAPSRLPDWARGHVATHIARNADAYVNLCTWARTGVEIPMYSSRGDRDAQIEAGANRSAAEIVADVRQSAARLSAAFAALDEPTLKAIIRLGSAAAGAESSASAIPWMRLREVEIHLVDLNLKPTFSETPIEFLTALLTEETPRFDGKIAGLELICIEGPRFPIGDGAQKITGSIADLAAWLLGRANGNEIARLSSDRPIPTPPKWL